MISSIHSFIRSFQTARSIVKTETDRQTNRQTETKTNLQQWTYFTEKNWVACTLAFEFQDEVPPMSLRWRRVFVVVIYVDPGDEQFNRRAVGRVQMALSASLRSTDIAIMLWSRIPTFSHVDAHRTTGRRQFDDGRRRSDERLRRQVPVLRSIPPRRHRVRRQPSTEAVERHSEPLSGKRPEASGTGGSEWCWNRVWHRLVVRIVSVEVVVVWIYSCLLYTSPSPRD